MEKNARAIIRRTDHAVYVKNETKKKKKRISFSSVYLSFFDSIHFRRMMCHPSHYS